MHLSVNARSSCSSTPTNRGGSPPSAPVWPAYGPHHSGGLGLTARCALGIPSALAAGDHLFDLPSLGTFPITLHASGDRASAGVERLRAIIRDEIALHYHAN